MTLCHKRALVLAGMHFLLSVAILMFGLATAWASAASGRSEPGLVEFVFYSLQPLWFLMTRLYGDIPLAPALVSIPLCSLLYGYGISGLLRLRGANRNYDGA